MLRNTFKEYMTLLGGQGNPRSWQNAQQISRGIWTRNIATPSRSLLRTGPTKQLASTRQNIARALPKARTSVIRSSRRTFHNTSRLRDAKNATKESVATAAKEAEPQGLSARLKKLSKEYGWTAVGVYLGLSVLDFPFCFLLVRIVGTERIGEIEHFVTENIKKLIPPSVQDRWHEYRRALKDEEKKTFGNGEISEHVEMAGWGVEEATARNQAEASLGTQLALAYAIHKSFIFIRVPLTAAILPKVVKVLRSWGYNIGKKKIKP